MISDRRSAAYRAELFSMGLRRLASDIEARAQRPSDPRARGVWEADSAEVLGAGERLATWISDHPATWTGLTSCPAAVQVSAIRRHRVTPSALRGWADGWDAYVIAIDP